MTSATDLDLVRASLRLGLCDKASGILKRQKSVSNAWQVEAGFLALLNFENPEPIHISSTDTATRCRLLVLEGALLNRKRDPLGALALLVQAKTAAVELPTDVFLIDVHLEAARVYMWLGNAPQAIDRLLEALSLADDKPTQFVIYFRLAALYAELEHWNQAQTYINLSKKCAAGMKASVYYMQAVECDARIQVALQKDATAQLQELQSIKNLPPYLNFKLQSLRVEQPLQKSDALMVREALQTLQTLPLCQSEDSFEQVAASVLSAKLDMLELCPAPAISKLLRARDWFSEEDLALRLVDARITLARAYAQNGQSSEAAGELDLARSYCQSRGLSLQLERVEGCFADLNLALYPTIERQRSVSPGSWKNRQAYVILERLGEGGQGSVFRAHDNARNKIVALKKLKIKGAAALAAVAREVRAANAAVIPNVARIIACGQDEDGLAYIVQDYISGRSLRQFMETQPQPKDILPVLRKVAETLYQLHLKGVVHGDVKPENILITPQGEAVLVDFGVANITGSKLGLESGATARYAPPAIVAMFRRQSWRDDYALGLMLLESLGTKLQTPLDWRRSLSANGTAVEVNQKVANQILALLLDPIQFRKNRPELWQQLLL